MKYTYLLLVFVLTLTSCKKKISKKTSEAEVHLLIYGTPYDFELKRDGIDNMGIVTDVSSGGKYTTLTATDANTMDKDPLQQLKIIIGFAGATDAEYTFHVDPNDSSTPHASVTINLPGTHLNSEPDFISWENGFVGIVEVGDKGEYIEGSIDGQFVDTQLGNGMAYQDMPKTTIHGTFKIYRSN